MLFILQLIKLAARRSAAAVNIYYYQILLFSQSQQFKMQFTSYTKSSKFIILLIINSAMPQIRNRRP